MSDSDPDNKKLTLNYANENRKSEIALLWTRALYFWGFIAALFVLYGVLLQYGHRTVALFAASLGIICSFSWTLANRSSKYWQEVWEKKVESAADNVAMANIFPRSTNPEIREFWFWGPKQYSPSKLAIAVSDVIVLGWIVLAVAAVIPRIVQLDSIFGNIVVIASSIGIVVFTVAYCFAMFFWCRSGDRFKWAEVLAIIRHRVGTAASRWS